MDIPIHSADGRVLAVLALDFSLTVVLPPPVETITSFRFTFTPTPKGPATMTGNIVLAPVDASYALTSRPVSVVINGGAPAVVDMINPAATFTCNPGDSVAATPTGSVNAAGTGPAGATFTATAPTAPPPPPSLPIAETITAINFTA